MLGDAKEKNGIKYVVFSETEKSHKKRSWRWKRVLKENFENMPFSSWKEMLPLCYLCFA